MQSRTSTRDASCRREADPWRETVWRFSLLLLFLLSVPAVAVEPHTAAAKFGQWRASDSALAQVRARQQAGLSLPFAGRITAVEVEPGARVEADAPLLRFDAPRLRQHLAAWQQTLREVKLAQKRLTVLRQSESQHTITRRELIAGELAVAQAQGRAQMAWETLAADLDLLHVRAEAKKLAVQLDRRGLPAVAQTLAILRAPFAGLVVERQAALGEQITAGQPVLELESLESVYLDVGIPQDKLPSWQGGETRWQIGAKQGRADPLDGTARYDAASGLWLLRYRAVNPDGLLQDGAWVEVRHLSTPKEVIWVPAAAVAARNGKSWCIVRRGDYLEPVEVQAGPEENGRIPILSGLSAGERVVTKGAYELLYRDLKELIRFED